MRPLLILLLLCVLSGQASAQTDTMRLFWGRQFGSTPAEILQSMHAPGINQFIMRPPPIKDVEELLCATSVVKTVNSFDGQEYWYYRYDGFPIHLLSMTFYKDRFQEGEVWLRPVEKIPRKFIGKRKIPTYDYFLKTLTNEHGTPGILTTDSGMAAEWVVNRIRIRLENSGLTHISYEDESVCPAVR